MAELETMYFPRMLLGELARASRVILVGLLLGAFHLIACLPSHPATPPPADAAPDDTDASVEAAGDGSVDDGGSSDGGDASCHASAVNTHTCFVAMNLSNVTGLATPSCVATFTGAGCGGCEFQFSCSGAYGESCSYSGGPVNAGPSSASMCAAECASATALVARANTLCPYGLQ